MADRAFHIEKAEEILAAANNTFDLNKASLHIKLAALDETPPSRPSVGVVDVKNWVPSPEEPAHPTMPSFAFQAATLRAVLMSTGAERTMKLRKWAYSQGLAAAEALDYLHRLELDGVKLPEPAIPATRTTLIEFVDKHRSIGSVRVVGTDSTTTYEKVARGVEVRITRGPL